MKRVFLAVSIGVALLVSGLMLQGASGVGLAQEVWSEHNYDAPEVLHCYSIQEGDSPARRTMLTTENFGRDLAQVRQGVMMCEQAGKYHPADSTDESGTVTGAPGDHVLECYSLAHGSDPDDGVVLHTRNFGADKVVVRQAGLMCEGARKHFRAKDSGGFGKYQTRGTPGDHVLQCYRILRGDDPEAKVVLETKNFGKEKVVVRQAIVMCEEARAETPDSQDGTVGQSTGYVWECYRLTDGANPQEKVVLETRSFGRDAVVIGQSSLMCERAKKDHFPGAGW